MCKVILRIIFNSGLLIILIVGLMGCSRPAVSSASAQSVQNTPSKSFEKPAASSAKPSIVSPENPSPGPSTTPSMKPSEAPENVADNYFTQSGEDIKISTDKTEWLYRSPSLYVHITAHNKTDVVLRYFVADIRVRNGEIIQSGFSDAKHPGANALLPYLIAKQYRAVFATNADYFEDKRNPSGIIIRGGKVYKDDTKADSLAVMPDGTLKVYVRGETNAQELLDLGVKNTFSFGPTLIKDGMINQSLKKERLFRANPRCGIGMIEKGHYISIVVEGRNPKESRGVTLEEYAQMYADAGCTVAYNLDGGASSAMVFMGEVLNIPTNILTTKTYRRVPDVLMIGSSDLVSDFKPSSYHNN